jgi:hypothetical protein
MDELGRTYKVLNKTDEDKKPYKIPFNVVSRNLRDKQKREWNRYDTTDEATAARLRKKFDEERLETNRRYKEYNRTGAGVGICPPTPNMFGHTRTTITVDNDIQQKIKEII